MVCAQSSLTVLVSSRSLKESHGILHSSEMYNDLPRFTSK